MERHELVEEIMKHKKVLYGNPPELGLVHKVNYLWKYGHLVMMAIGAVAGYLVNHFITKL